MKKSTISKKQEGSIAVEYMVLTVFIGLALIVGATALGTNLNSGLSSVGASISNILGGDRGGNGGQTETHPFNSSEDTKIQYYLDTVTQQHYDVIVDGDNGNQYYIGEDGTTQNYLEDNAGYMVGTDKDGQIFVYRKE